MSASVPPLARTPDGAQYKAAVARSSFHYAFWFLPRPRREALTAFYAFCREVDDVVDAAGAACDVQAAAAQLAWWQDEVRNSFAGQATHAAMRALMAHAPQYGIRAQHLLDVIAGCQMDLQCSRYADFESLRRYCHLVAGVVGEVSARIFGQTQAATTAYAHELGLALQLTNILRDVGEDALRGRIYLPQDALRAHGLSEADILALRYSAPFEALMREQAARAQCCYDRALALLPAADARAQKPGLMMAAIYRALLHRIERKGFAQSLRQRTRVHALHKLYLACKVQALGAAGVCAAAGGRP